MDFYCAIILFFLNVIFFCFLSPICFFNFNGRLLSFLKKYCNPISVSLCHTNIKTFSTISLNKEASKSLLILCDLKSIPQTKSDN